MYEVSMACCGHGRGGSEIRLLRGAFKNQLLALATDCRNPDHRAGYRRHVVLGMHRRSTLVRTQAFSAYGITPANPAIFHVLPTSATSRALELESVRTVRHVCEVTGQNLCHDILNCTSTSPLICDAFLIREKRSMGRPRTSLPATCQRRAVPRCHCHLLPRNRRLSDAGNHVHAE